MKCFPGILLIFLIPNFLFGMPDTIRIEEIKITDSYITDNTGHKMVSIDTVTFSNYGNESLATLLSIKSPLFIKDYGPGNIATSSFRGANASHTQVLWNGININSPMLGQIDFSQLPANFIDDITIYHGGATVSGNSGSIGGTISLSNKPSWNNKEQLNLSQEFGSFGKSHSHIAYSNSNKKLAYRLKLLYNIAENDFLYKIPPYNESETYTQKNASYNQKGISQEIYYRLNSNNQFTLIAWYQDNYNEIPSSANDEDQYNNFLRTIARFKHFGDQYTIKVHSGYVYNYMNYNKEITQTDSKNEIHSNVNKVSFERNIFTNHKLYSGLHYTLHRVVSNNYEDIKERKEADFTLGIKNDSKSRLLYNFSLKQLLVDGEMSDIIPSVGAEFKLIQNKLILKSNLDRNYHFPTLNDLYWEYDGNTRGNTNLKPENGFSSELGFAGKIKSERVSFNYELTGFYSVIDNWINWHEKYDSILFRDIWFPENIKKVERKGIELNANVSYSLKDFIVKGSMNYQYVKATNKHTQNEIDNSKNKQLIYVPESLLSFSLLVFYRNNFINVYSNFVDKRFTSSDNSNSLPAYNIINVVIGRKFTFNRHQANVQFGVQNVTNQDYQVFQGRPMPKRYYTLKLSYSLLQK